MKKERTIRRDRVRIYLFSSMAMLSIVSLYMILLNGPDSNNPRVHDTWAYMIISNVVFMSIMTVCALAKSIYIGKSYDMDHVWVWPTIGFNGKSMYIIWLRFEIFVRY